MKWIGVSAAAEVLAANQVVVWRLAQLGKLKRHNGAPESAPFLQRDVERLARQVILTPEVVQLGKFATYREATAWLRKQNVKQLIELKKEAWRIYPRAAVESALKKGRDTSGAAWSGLRKTKSTTGSKTAKLVGLENREADYISKQAAAEILGCNALAVQRLCEIGKLRRRKALMPFNRRVVERLAEEIIFLPEMQRKSGFVSRGGVMDWLDKERCSPILILVGKTPVFSRPQFHRLLAKPIVGNTHREEVRARLFDHVSCGSTVHSAAELCGVKYATAKRWVALRDASQA